MNELRALVETGTPNWAPVFVYLERRLPEAARTELNGQYMRIPSYWTAGQRQQSLVWFVQLLSRVATSLHSMEVFTDASSRRICVHAFRAYATSAEPPDRLMTALVKLPDALRICILYDLFISDLQIADDMLSAINQIACNCDDIDCIVRMIMETNLAPPRCHFRVWTLVTFLAQPSSDDVMRSIMSARSLSDCEGIFWMCSTILELVPATDAIDCDYVCLMISVKLYEERPRSFTRQISRVLTTLARYHAYAKPSSIVQILRAVSECNMFMYTVLCTHTGHAGDWPAIDVLDSMRNIFWRYMNRTIVMGVCADPSETHQYDQRVAIIAAMLSCFARYPSYVLDECVGLDDMALQCCIGIESTRVLSGVRLLMDTLDRPAMRTLCRCSDASMARTAVRLLNHWKAWCGSLQSVSDLNEAIDVSNLRKFDVDNAWDRLRRTLEDVGTSVERCPITLDIPRSPVLCSDGYTYEFTAIVQWMRQNANASSPMTRQTITSVRKNRDAVACMDAELSNAMRRSPDDVVRRARKRRYRYSSTWP